MGYWGQPVMGGISMWREDSTLLCPSCDVRFIKAICPTTTTLRPLTCPSGTNLISLAQLQKEAAGDFSQTFDTGVWGSSYSGTSNDNNYGYYLKNLKQQIQAGAAKYMASSPRQGVCRRPIDPEPPQTTSADNSRAACGCGGPCGGTSGSSSHGPSNSGDGGGSGTGDISTEETTDDPDPEGETWDSTTTADEAISLQSQELDCCAPPINIDVEESAQQPIQVVVPNNIVVTSSIYVNTSIQTTNSIPLLRNAGINDLNGTQNQQTANGNGQTFIIQGSTQNVTTGVGSNGTIGIGFSGFDPCAGKAGTPGC